MGEEQLTTRGRARAFQSVGALLSVTLLLAGCHSSSSALGSFTDSDVSVEVRIVQRDGQDVVAVRFRPLKSGFHLYSKDLVATEVRNLGVATRVDLVSGLAPAGPSYASDHEVELLVAELGLSVPVYPDGPITIFTPVRLLGGSASITVTYAACSDSVCLRPVVAHPIDFDLPSP